MIRIALVLFLIAIPLNVSHAQDITPEMLGFKSHKVDHATLGEINFYLSEGDNTKPLLVYLDGSGPFPLFQKTKRGIGSTVVINFQSLIKSYRILLISKPGIPFYDEVGSDTNGFPTYEAPLKYTKNLTLDWRSQSTNAAIDWLLENKQVNSEKIIVFGFSEGAQVAPYVAELNSKVSHLMLFGGNGLNQFFDPIVSARMNAKAGIVTEEQAQKTIDSLFTQYKDIYQNGNEVNKSWWGHSYARWNSFTKRSPIDVLTHIDIPIYFANGSKDVNSVLSADYLQLEFIKKGKTNLTYKTYPNLDHQFNEVHYENGQFKGATPKMQSVMQEAFKWLNSTEN